MSKLGDFANGVSTANQAVTLGACVVAGIVSLTLLYAQVDDAAKAAEDNKEKIAVIEETLRSLETQQGVIIERIDGEKEKNKEFRSRTDRSLRRILERVAPRDPPVR